VTNAAGQLVDAIRGVTCDDLALTPLQVCPAGV
jgi:hypothetical protein